MIDIKEHLRVLNETENRFSNRVVQLLTDKLSDVEQSAQKIATELVAALITGKDKSAIPTTFAAICLRTGGNSHRTFTWHDLFKKIGISIRLDYIASEADELSQEWAVNKLLDCKDFYLKVVYPFVIAKTQSDSAMQMLSKGLNKLHSGELKEKADELRAARDSSDDSVETLDVELLELRQIEALSAL